jgi:filamentous hemagglutinin family protein
VFNKKLGMLVPVAENVVSQTKGAGATAGMVVGADGTPAGMEFSLGKMGAFLALAFGVSGAASAQMLPTDGQVVAGAASINTPASNQMVINQASQNAIINWQSFGIGNGASVQFVQPNVDAAVLNRVIGNDISQINGSLSANGKVFVSNPNGIVFGAGAYVDVGGIMATTKDISNNKFMSGDYTFMRAAGAGDASVTNKGTINANNGFVVLHGDKVDNQGNINANNGKVILGAGDGATLSLSNGLVVNVDITAPTANALIHNNGTITADNGSVLLTARGNNAVLDSVINVEGVVQAKGGYINIDGGTNGVVELNKASIDASSANAKGGTVVVQGQRVGLFNGTNINASGATGGGLVIVGGDSLGKLSNQTIAFSDTVVLDETSRIHASATGNGDGGFVETSAHNIQIKGTVRASAMNGKAGQWLIDPSNINIGTTDSLTNTSNVWATNNATGTIANTTIQNSLNNGTSVTVTTNGTGGGTGVMNVQNSIYKTAGGDAALTLYAGGALTFSNGVKVTSTAGALDFKATAAAGTLTLNNNEISLNGGNLSLSGSGISTSSDGVSIQAGANFNAHNINITGQGRYGVYVNNDANVNINATGDMVINGTGGYTVGYGNGIRFGEAGRVAQRTNIHADGNLTVRGTSNSPRDSLDDGGIYSLSREMNLSGNNVVINGTGTNSLGMTPAD